MRCILPIVLTGLTLPLAGCGAPIVAPSLNLRPVERDAIPLPATAAAEPETAADPALAGLLARHVGAAETGDRQFQTLRAQAEKAVMAARDAAAGSEPWTAAQQAVSALEAARGPVRDAALAVDSLEQDPANAGMAARTVIARAAGQIDALQAAETGAVATLGARLR